MSKDKVRGVALEVVARLSAGDQVQRTIECLNAIRTRQDHGDHLQAHLMRIIADVLERYT